MNSSGIKRGLAATAIAALAVAGIPALSDSASAIVGTVSVAGANGWTAFDTDESAGNDDLIATVLETGGTPTPAGQDVEYNFVRTTEAGVVQPESGWLPGGAVAGAAGKVNLTFMPAGTGSYSIRVRTQGSQIVSAPFVFVVGESEVFWADGASASSPVNGSDTYTGTLALNNAAKTALPGRRVDVTYSNVGGQAAFTSPQVPPSVLDSPSTAHATTIADGKFTFSLTDPAAPAGTPESGTLTGSAVGLGVGDPVANDASADLAVSFEPTPVVKAVTLTTKDVFDPGEVGPGKPVELNVQVTSEGPTPAPGDDIVLKDYPVAFTVDKGFLSPDSKPGLTTGMSDLALTADQDDLGDLFGFYQDLGLTETVDTSDNQPANAAGIIATIAKDAGFNDDGLVDQTVTVTAGGKTATKTITYDARDYLNITAAAFRRDGSPAGNIQVPGAVDLKLYAADQFGNLVGDEFAKLSDNTPIARVTGDPNGATTDYINDNPSARASSSQPVSQTVTARIPANKAVVDKDGNPVITFFWDNTDVVATHVINWVAGGGPGTTRTPIAAKLSGADNGAAADTLTVKAPAKAAGAIVKLFKIVDGKAVAAGTKTLGSNGRVSFTKADKNGNGRTTYFAKVRPTSDTQGDRTNTLRVR